MFLYLYVPFVCMTVYHSVEHIAFLSSGVTRGRRAKQHGCRDFCVCLCTQTSLCLPVCMCVQLCLCQCVHKAALECVVV